MGGYAEVVSDMECYIARKIGYNDNKIIYNGPIKGKLGNEVILNGGLLNIDNLEELRKIIVLANRNPNKNLRIGIRVNIDVGQSFISRFGIDADSEDLSNVIKMVNDVNNLEIQGIHCHVGQSRTIQSWENRINCVLEIVEKYFKNVKLNYIDLGSGMYGEMDEVLAVQFGNDLPKYKDYAAVIGKALRKYYKDWSYEDKPILFTEPGATLINHYMDFVCSVSSIKHIKGKNFVILNCSKHNLGEICTLKKLPIQIIHNGNNTEKLRDAKLVGYTCLEHDVMYTGFEDELAVDDYIIFGNIGGYSNVDKPPFILPNCPILSIEGDSIEVIKRRETYEDILQSYVI